MNILRKEADQVPDGEPDPALMNEKAEKELYAAFQSLENEASGLFGQGDFTGFLKSVAALKTPIDAFFDAVMVMDKDEAVRRNRLALLNRIASLFGQMAQFTLLQLV